MIEQVTCPCPAQSVDIGVHIFGDARDDHYLLNVKDSLQTVFQLKDVPQGGMDDDLNHALLASLLKQAVHLGRR